MTPRRYHAWVRLLCALALGLGLSGAAAAAAGSTIPAQTRTGIAQLESNVHAVTAAATRAPLALSHHAGRHIPPSIGSAFLGAALLVGALAVATRRRTTTGGNALRRSSPVGARAPPVAIGS